MIINECDWEITTNCNLNCKHCLIKREKKELNTEECLKVIDNLSKNKCKRITFTGGEPLIKKDFFKILEYAHKKRIDNWVFTNGTLINKRSIKKIKKYITYLGFSIDGLEKENDLIRGKGSFKKTINAINLVKKEKMPFGIYVTLTKYNINYLKEILDYIKKINPINIGINELVNRGNAKKNKDEIGFLIDKKNLIINVKKIFSIKKFAKTSKCAIKPKRVFIDPLSNIYACTEIKQTNSSSILGNILNQDLSKYNKFNKFLSFRKGNKSCPYECYCAENINITFLNSSRCSLKNEI